MNIDSDWDESNEKDARPVRLTIDIQLIQLHIHGCVASSGQRPGYLLVDTETAWIKKGGERIEVHLARLSIRLVEDILPAPSKLCGLASVVQCIQIVRSGIGEINATVD